MRGLLTLLFGAAALLAAFATMPVAWVAHNVASEDGYVSFTEPLVKDKAFHTALADAIANSIVVNSPVSAPLRAATSTAISSATLKFADTPGFVTAWDETQRQSHRIMFGDQRALPARLNPSNRLAVDLGPLSQYVVAQADKDLPIKLAVPHQLIVTIGGSSSATAFDEIRKTPGWTSKGLIATGALLALCLVFARRRGFVVALLGVGSVAVAVGLHALAAQVIPTFVNSSTSNSSFARAVLTAFDDQANRSFDHWLLTLGVAGIVAIVAGGVVAAGIRPRSRA